MTKLTIEEAFGVGVVTKRNLRGQRKLVPPPPGVLAVLGDQAQRIDACPPGHSLKTSRRRAKRARLRARDRLMQRTTWRRFFDDKKRLAAQAAQMSELGVPGA